MGKMRVHFELVIVSVSVPGTSASIWPEGGLLSTGKEAEIQRAES